MERLQAAIAQARKNREGSAPQQRAATSNGDALPAKPAKTPRSAARTGDQSALQAKWNEIKPLELDNKLLERNRVNYLGPAANAAPFDILRTRILSEMGREGWKRLLVTSATSSVGKSTTCANLALSLSRQPDIRAMILECDLRRPSLAKMLGVKRTGASSFHEVLDGRAEFAEQARRIGSNVIISVNSHAARDPAELLQSRRATDVLNELQDTYQPDLIVFDLPPLLAHADTLGFLGNVDCAMLMAMAERSTVDELDMAEKELSSHTNVLGVVLNRCRFASSQYGYDYNY